MADLVLAKPLGLAVMGLLSTRRLVRAEHRALARIQPCRAQGQPKAAWASWVGRFCRAGACTGNGKRVASEFGCGQPARIASLHQQPGGQAFFGADRAVAQFNLIEFYPGDGVRNHGHLTISKVGDGHARQGRGGLCRNHRVTFVDLIERYPGGGVRNHGHLSSFDSWDGHARQGCSDLCRNHRFALVSGASEWFQRGWLMINLTAFLLCRESFRLFGLCSRGVSAPDRGL